MVTSVTSLPYYSYLGTLTGQTNTDLPATTSTSSASGGSTTNALTSNATTSELSSLLGSTNGYGPQVLSLLQENGANGFSPITSLLGGTSSGGDSNGLTTLLTNLYASAAAATLQGATSNATTQTAATSGTSSGSGTSTPVSPINSLLQQQTQASIAYNQTLVQNAQNITNENSYGVTPLIA